MPRSQDRSPGSQKAPTTDRMRKRIDNGETGDKVGFPDPAAAPMGTDDEAAGRPADARRRAQSAQQAKHPHNTSTGNRLGDSTALICVAVALTILLVAAAFLLYNTV